LVSILNTQLAQAALALYITAASTRWRRSRHGGTDDLFETTNLILFSTVGAIAFPGGAPLLLLALPLVLGMVDVLISLARGKLGS
jgi:hypothetical protein